MEDKLFLLYYPLKQGLKLSQNDREQSANLMFLLYYPLKQGLKQSDKKRDNSLHKNCFYSTIH